MALLGPNESGKTSVLEALEHLARTGFPAATQFTDRQARPADEEILSARFQLEPADYAAIRETLRGRPVTGLETLETTREWSLVKLASGERRIVFDVPLQRDPSERLQFAADLEQLLQAEWTSLPLHVYEQEHQDRLLALATALRDHLGAQGDPVLGAEAVGALREFESALEEWAEAVEADALLEQWLDRVRAVRVEETGSEPSIAASHALFHRMPAFIRFDGDVRTLAAFTPFTGDPSPSLVNLLATAESRFEDLASMAGREDGREALAEEERRINLRLEELFNAWSQRDVTAAIKIDGDGVEVVGRDRAAPIIDAPFDQRSAGMRMFAALVAFLHAKSESWASRPVLLVDEAEMHLHYDAQADLVRMFELQDIAQAVIYTTHSIGCLPEDLGLGIVVVEESGDERSRLSQCFWTGGPGLTPLMVALGATALSFTPARRVLIGEGAHETILLPTMLREVRPDVDTSVPLGFQVVGSLAEISRKAAARLDEEAGTVVYIVDNDDGGSGARAVLPEHVRESGRVLVLGEGTDAISIEDFVAANILVQAIDEVLAADRRPRLRLDPAEVPVSGRAAWASDRLAGAGSPDARTRLAQAAVIAGAEGGLVEPARADTLRATFAGIVSAFPRR